MTTPPSLLQRAQQGDAVAIAVLMNDVLQAQDVWAKVMLNSDCLQVMLKAPTVLHQAHCVTFIRRGLLRLQPESINQVTAYAWRVGDVFPLWIATFSLEPPPLLQSQSDQSQSDEATAAVARSSADHASPKESVAPPARPTRRSSNTVKQHFDLFKLGFVLVLTTMVYFVVLGV